MDSKKSYRINLIIGGSLLVIIMLLTFISIFYLPYDPDAMAVGGKFEAPTLQHIFGTDNFGRDIYCRVIRGAGTTFYVGTLTILIGGGMGILIGAVTGYFGGILDEIMMRISDAIASFPSILIALIFISLLGPGKEKVIIALSIAFIPSFSRLVRSEILKEKNMDYVKSAKLMGVSDARIIFIHILPNTTPVLLSAVAIGFNNAILAESGMSYLGIGVQPPNASLGSMLADSQAYLSQSPWYAIAPGCTIILMALGFGLLSDGLNHLK
jgi:peptide/nickel transport system permease protein